MKREPRDESLEPPRGWVHDMLMGLLWAACILVSILFYTGAASKFIYVDF